MDTPNPMFAKFDQVLGKTTPTTSTGPVNSRADEIRALAGGGNSSKSTLAEDISSSIQKRGEKVYGNISGTSDESKNEGSLVKGIQATGNAFGAITDTAGNIISHVIPQSMKDKFNEQNSQPNPLRDAVRKAYDDVNDKVGVGLDELVRRFPAVGHALESALKIGSSGGEIAGGILTAEGAAESGNKVVDLGSKAIDKTKEIAGNIKDTVTGKINEITTPEQNDLEKINETISSKPIIKQAKLAETEGRLYKGSKPTTFKSGGEDQIATSEQGANSARTIQKLIPDAANMDEPTLYQALDEKIGETAKSLKPEMESTLIHPDTVEKIGSDWEETKATQSDNAYLPSDVNVKKLQADFEERIKEIGDGKNMNDIWETRKAYDASVPTNVKTANDLSSEALQAKKDIWLQNRKILTDAINDTENGMGATSKQAFQDMRNMYEGQNGILSKAKINTKVAPSNASQFFNKTTTGKIIKHLVKGAVGATVGKSVGGTAGEVAGGVIGAGL